MSDASLPTPARTTSPPLDKELLADAVEEALARLREARPHLARRLDRAAGLLVMQLSSSPRTRPIKCRIRRGGKRVLLVASLTSSGAVYEVSPADWSCSCPDHHRHGPGCKHSLGCWVLATAYRQLIANGHADWSMSGPGQAILINRKGLEQVRKDELRNMGGGGIRWRFLHGPDIEADRAALRAEEQGQDELGEGA